MSVIGVIGYGVVGMATAEVFGKTNQVLWHGPLQKRLNPTGQTHLLL